MKRILIIIFGMAVLWSCNDPWEDRFDRSAEEGMTVLEILSGNPEYSTYLDLLEKSGMDTILNRNSVFTLFVPESGSLEAISSLDADTLYKILSYHISNSIVYSTDVQETKSIKTLSGKQLFLERKDGMILLNQTGQLTETDIKSSNGVIHKTDKVQEIRPNLMELLVADSNFSYLSEFILSGTEVYFDEQSSIPVGIDSIGQTIYDSVWLSSNDFFSQYADLSSEENSFTIFFANNTLLDTSAGGDYQQGYMAGLPKYIIPGIWSEDDLPASLAAVNGKTLNLPIDKYEFFTSSSNGLFYTLTSLENIGIPVSQLWEITDIPEFDSIRGIKTTDYIPYYDQFNTLRTAVTEGEFVDFKYERKGGYYNSDYLKITTLGGTFATLEMDMPELVPGKYKLSVYVNLRLSDGIDYDAYVNKTLVSAGNNFNGGEYKNKLVEVGDFEVTERSGNVLIIDIDGSNATHTRCWIDYFLFEPTK